ncbi:MAG: hypothetical protein EAX89_03140 [Candidatus Lokiarchaeota archaeon]|nr:hypothetical protein [Candidatus Lokiarchaeota archaeon]
MVLMAQIEDNKWLNIKNLIFNQGRLLERKLYSYFFEKGSKEGVLKALSAYQNDDGGFGNGIEPDILCPDSSAIGAETALYILDLLDLKEEKLSKKLIDWIINAQNNEGFIDHPPKNLFNYPFQPWWKNPDDKRILILAAILRKWDINSPKFFKRVNRYFSNLTIPDKFQIYDYPFFVYLKYCGDTQEETELFFKLLEYLPKIIKEYKNHFPLLSRYWFYLADNVKASVLKEEVNTFITSIENDGGIRNPFENLPWWKPIFTLDGLILMKKFNFLE